ncbi:hypothetical protein D3C78_1688170 [compost metagenome]
MRVLELNVSALLEQLEDILDGSTDVHVFRHGIGVTLLGASAEMTHYLVVLLGIPVVSWNGVHVGLPAEDVATYCFRVFKAHYLILRL